MSEFPRLVCPIPKDPPQPPKERSGQKSEGRWVYRDTEGRALKVKIRFPHKERGKVVLPYTLWEIAPGRLEWFQKDLPAPRPLYGLDRLASSSEGSVLVFEGEKAAKAGQEMFPDWVCITSGSATSTGSTDWTPLSGRRVVIFPDHDEPGRKYAEDVRKALQKIAASVAVVQVPEGFPLAWDIADPLPGGWEPGQIQELVGAALEAKVEVKALKRNEEPTPAWVIGDTARYLREVPPPVCWIVEGLIPAGVPGVFVARAGAGKSMTALVIGMGLASGIGVLGRAVSPDAAPGVVYVGMEDDEPEFHRRYRRALDLLREDPRWSPSHENLLSERFVPLFPDYNSGALFRLELQADAIRDIANAISGGCGLIIADTLSRLSHGDENSAEGTRPFLEAQAKLVQGTGATVMAIHHVRKGNDVSSDKNLWDRLDLENMRGSGAIEGTVRFGITMAALSTSEAEASGLDLEQAQRGGYVALHLGKMSYAERGSTVILERRISGTAGAGFLCPHPDSERIIASLRSEASLKKLLMEDRVLMVLAEAGGLNTLDQAAEAEKLWPNSKNPDGQWRKHLTGLRKKFWLSDPQLTPAGIAHAETLGFCSAGTSGKPIHSSETQRLGHCSAGTNGPEQPEQPDQKFVPTVPVPYRAGEWLEQIESSGSDLEIDGGVGITLIDGRIAV